MTDAGKTKPFPVYKTVSVADLDCEVWKPIPIAEGYEASSLGRIRSVTRTISDGRTFTGRILKPWIAGEGYLYVDLGKSLKMGVNRAVAMAFHGMPEDGMEAAHLDGIKANNRQDNLVWATHAENEQHKRLHGTYARPINFGKPGQKKRGPAPSVHPLAQEIAKRRSDGASLRDLAAAFGMSKSGMACVLKGRMGDAA